VDAFSFRTPLPSNDFPELKDKEPLYLGFHPRSYLRSPFARTHLKRLRNRHRPGHISREIAGFPAAFKWYAICHFEEELDESNIHRAAELKGLFRIYQGQSL
jgi:hypothetical protein